MDTGAHGQSDKNELATSDAGIPEREMAEEYLESFGALKTSMSQGRDLRKKRKALEEYNKTLETLKAAHLDRVQIAQDADSAIGEQERIIARTQRSLDNGQEKLADVEKMIERETEEQAALKRELEGAMRPLETELERRSVELASAKDELKQVKAQRESLELFEGDGANPNDRQAAHDEVVEHVSKKLDAAKAAHRDAQKALDAREKENRSKLKRAGDSIKHLKSEREKIQEGNEELRKKIDAAHERIAFCEYVVAHPEETVAMEQRIAENERTSAEMGAQIERLAATHRVSKAASTKARVLIAIVIAILAVIVIFMMFVSR